MTDVILDVIDQTLLGPLKEMIQMWDYLGYDEDQRQKRVSLMNEKLKVAILEILREENQQRMIIESQLEEYKKNCSKLSNALELAAFFPPRNLSIYEAIKQLKEKNDELEAIKSERLDTYTKSVDNIKKFSRLLVRDMQNYDSSILNHLTDTQPNMTKKEEIVNLLTLEKLENLESTLESEYAQLFEQYTLYSTSIGKIAKDFGYMPTTKLEADILRNQGINNVEIQRPSTPGIVRSNNFAKQVEFKDYSYSVNNEPDDDCQLVIDKESGQPVIKSELINVLKNWQSKLVKEKARVMGICEELRNYLQTIWKRLAISEEHQRKILDQCQTNTKASLDILREEMSNCDELKWEQLNVYVEGIKTEYLQLVELCCVEQNVKFDAFETDKESLVCEIEREIDRLKLLYDENQEIFNYLMNYRKLWNDLYDVEKRMKDPAILSNRGGILLKTEKEKKRILRDLKTNESAIVEKINKIDGDAKQMQFFQGLNFEEYADKKHKDYEFMLKESTKSSRRVSTMRNGLPGAP